MMAQPTERMVGRIKKTFAIAGFVIVFIAFVHCMYATSILGPRHEVQYGRQLRSQAALKVTYEMIDGEGDIRKQRMFLVLEPESPFYKAGVRSGDQLIPPHPINFHTKIWSHQGKMLPVVVERDGKVITAHVPIPFIPGCTSVGTTGLGG